MAEGETYLLCVRSFISGPSNYGFGANVNARSGSYSTLLTLLKLLIVRQSEHAYCITKKIPQSLCSLVMTILVGLSICPTHYRKWIRFSPRNQLSDGKPRACGVRADLICHALGQYIRKLLHVPRSRRSERPRAK